MQCTAGDVCDCVLSGDTSSAIQYFENWGTYHFASLTTVTPLAYGTNCQHLWMNSRPKQTGVSGSFLVMLVQGSFNWWEQVLCCSAHFVATEVLWLSGFDGWWDPVTFPLVNMVLLWSLASLQEVSVCEVVSLYSLRDAAVVTLQLQSCLVGGAASYFQWKMLVLWWLRCFRFHWKVLLL